MSANAVSVFSFLIVVVVEGKRTNFLATTAVEGVTIVIFLPLFGKALVTSSLSRLEAKVIEELFSFEFLNKSVLCFRTTLYVRPSLLSIREF